MAITEAQLADARAAKSKQDKKYPHLIHVDDGRLLPNIETLRKHPKYRVYRGDSSASLAERLRYLQSQGVSGGRRAVVDSSASEPFDLSKASKEELTAFASEQYDIVFAPGTPVMSMRQQIARADAALREPASDESSLG